MLRTIQYNQMTVLALEGQGARSVQVPLKANIRAALAKMHLTLAYLLAMGQAYRRYAY